MVQIDAQHAKSSPMNCHDMLYGSFAADSTVIAG